MHWEGESSDKVIFKINSQSLWWLFRNSSQHLNEVRVEKMLKLSFTECIKEQSWRENGKVIWFLKPQRKFAIECLLVKLQYFAGCFQWGLTTTWIGSQDLCDPWLVLALKTCLILFHPSYCFILDRFMQLPTNVNKEMSEAWWHHI